MVTAQISGFLVKRVMIDQGSGADVMYPELFKGLGLRKKDLMKHTSPLVGFDGKVVIPEGANFPSRDYGRERGGCDISNSKFIFLVYCHPGKTVDPLNEGCPINTTCKD